MVVSSGIFALMLHTPPSVGGNGERVAVYFGGSAVSGLHIGALGIRGGIKFLSRVMAAILVFTACQQGLVLSASAESMLTLTPKISENVTVDVEGGQISVTDTDANNDVWSSKVLFETDKALVPGQEYKISFDLKGTSGVGELFLCKSENLDDRYDETFTAEEGSRSITFTAAGEKLYVGMQVGNVGNGNTVNAVISDICEREKSENPDLLQAVNCDVKVEDGKITATDTGDGSDVWNSKLLYDAGVELEVGKSYEVEFTLSGDQGVGEFFLCKSQDLNDRYDSTFVNTPGKKTVSFTAESTRLYIGMQFGSLGKGNSVSAAIDSVKTCLPKYPEPNTVYTITNENGVLVIEATDNSLVNDVWDSSVLCDIYQDLVPGRQYEISFELSGAQGVGEFFLCKSADLNDRYDATFTNASGLNTVVFTAEGTHAYIGMQLGNIGKGNSVTAKITNLAPYDAASGGKTGVRVAQNCTQSVTRTVTEDADKTEISVTDTNDNNDVWTSKLLYFFGNILKTGKEYMAKINLSGSTDTMGEFYFLKSDNIDNRYSFDNVAGDHTVQFTAESEKLYAGVQFGNIGSGNDFVVTITDLFEKPFDTQYTDNCKEDMSRGSVTLTDTGDNNDVWNSKAVYNTGITLEPGKEYTVTFTLTGDNGVGEFFFLKSDNIDNRYSFDNTPGEHTITFTAEDAVLYMGIQCGNIGNGNSMTVSNITVTEKSGEAPAAVLPDLSADGGQAETPAEEIPAGEVPAEEAPAEEAPTEETTAEPTEETVAEDVPAGE